MRQFFLPEQILELETRDITEKSVEARTESGLVSEQARHYPQTPMDSAEPLSEMEDFLAALHRLRREHAFSRSARDKCIADLPPPDPADPRAPIWRAEIARICDAKMRKGGAERDARIRALVERARESPDSSTAMAYLRVFLHSLSRGDGKDSGRVCCRCGLAGEFFCAKCKGAWYCGPECQSASWAAHHKSMCKQVKLARREFHADRNAARDECLNL